MYIKDIKRVIATAGQASDCAAQTSDQQEEVKGYVLAVANERKSKQGEDG